MMMMFGKNVGWFFEIVDYFIMMIFPGGIGRRRLDNVPIVRQCRFPRIGTDPCRRWFRWYERTAPGLFGSNDGGDFGATRRRGGLSTRGNLFVLEK